MTEFKREDPRHKTGAIVEIVEIFRPSAGHTADTVPVIKVHLVYVNGTPVGLIDADDGIDLQVDPKCLDATKLTLTLLPRQVLIRAVAETPDQTVFDGPVDLADVQFVPIEPKTFEGTADEYGKAGDDV